MKYTLLVFISGFIIINISIAQEIEHNYLVGPQVTDCDSLTIHGLSMPESISKIRTAKFRFDQSFRLTRKQGLQLGEYYSCDGKDGFLIIKYDGIESLYVTVSMDIWKGLISSSDPEYYFLKIKPQFQKPR